MNPETQSTRAKITQTSGNSLVQAIVDSSRGSQGRLNSGDVGLLHRTASGSVTDLRQHRATGVRRSQSAVDPSTGPSEGSRAA
jgi:hypothetical protein